MLIRSGSDKTSDTPKTLNPFSKQGHLKGLVDIEFRLKCIFAEVINENVIPSRKVIETTLRDKFTEIKNVAATSGGMFLLKHQSAYNKAYTHYYKELHKGPASGFTSLRRALEAIPEPYNFESIGAIHGLVNKAIVRFNVHYSQLGATKLSKVVNPYGKSMEEKLHAISLAENTFIDELGKCADVYQNVQGQLFQLR